MINNLLEHATEFTIMHNGYVVKLTKRSDSVTTHYFHENTEYTHCQNEHRNSHGSIPNDAVIIYSNENGSGKWVAIIQGQGNHGYISNGGGYINWACRVMHQFTRILVTSCVFDTAEQALEASKTMIDTLSSLSKDEVNKLSSGSMDEARSKFVIDQYALPKPPEDKVEDLEIEEDEHSETTFFFIAHSDSTEASITVIDLHHCVDYERSEFRVIDEVNFRTAPAAIKYAKQVARLNGLKYEPFDTRYFSKYSEVTSQ
ncbi:hypothetical protein OTK49_02610 [Vibrio coralliirubri]|uniref:hypothetical protein n=1 Tax=Vibrio coralliirubri TaxID=1516159 RepID=UPI0022836A9C|nr:hypothetical protein [Vibrio coralliirubri]MCY9861409.1 hypothetical protein [Vibrio coralliirubri]